MLICLPRCRDHTVRSWDLALGQLIPRLFFFLLHPHPVQFTDQFYKLVRCSLRCRDVGRLLLIVPHLHRHSSIWIDETRVSPRSLLSLTTWRTINTMQLGDNDFARLRRLAFFGNALSVRRTKLQNDSSKFPRRFDLNQCPTDSCCTALSNVHRAITRSRSAVHRVGAERK